METWEAVSKNQDDPEKIEEAITRNIGDHLDDPNAHVETGQSLQSHKAAKVIDHLARSIVGDKINNIQTILKGKESGVISSTSFDAGYTTLTIEGKAWTADEHIGRALIVTTGIEDNTGWFVEDNGTNTLVFFTDEERGFAIGDVVYITKAVFGPDLNSWEFNNQEILAYNNESVSAQYEGLYLEVTLECDRIQIIGTKGTNFGYMNVYVDGALEDVVDLYDEAEYNKVVLYEKVFDTTAERVIKIEASDQKNALSSSTGFKINGIDVNGVIYHNSLQFSTYTQKATTTTTAYGKTAFQIIIPDEYQLFNMISWYYGAQSFYNNDNPILHLDLTTGQRVMVWGATPNTEYTFYVTYIVCLKDEAVE